MRLQGGCGECEGSRFTSGGLITLFCLNWNECEENEAMTSSHN